VKTLLSSVWTHPSRGWFKNSKKR